MRCTRSSCSSVGTASSTSSSYSSATRRTLGSQPAQHPVVAATASTEAVALARRPARPGQITTDASVDGIDAERHTGRLADAEAGGDAGHRARRPPSRGRSPAAGEGAGRCNRGPTGQSATAECQAPHAWRRSTSTQVAAATSGSAKTLAHKASAALVAIGRVSVRARWASSCARSRCLAGRASLDRHAATVVRNWRHCRRARSPTMRGMSADGLRAATAKMEAAGVHPTAITVFAHYYRQLESGATGLVHEADIRPLDSPPAIGDVSVSEQRLARRPRRHGRHQAQRRARHRHGHGPRQVAAAGARRPDLPRRHRPTGHVGPPRVGSAAAADVPELLPHPRRHARRPEPVRRPAGRRPAARHPAEPRAEAAARRPDAGRVARGPRARVVSAGARRPLHGAASRPACSNGCWRRACATPSSPTPTTWARPSTAGWRAGSPGPARRSPTRCAAVPRPTARADTWRSAGATGS